MCSASCWWVVCASSARGSGTTFCNSRHSKAHRAVWQLVSARPSGTVGFVRWADLMGQVGMATVQGDAWPAAWRLQSAGRWASGWRASERREAWGWSLGFEGQTAIVWRREDEGRTVRSTRSNKCLKYYIKYCEFAVLRSIVSKWTWHFHWFAFRALFVWSSLKHLHMMEKCFGPCLNKLVVYKVVCEVSIQEQYDWSTCCEGRTLIVRDKGSVDLHKLKLVQD